MRLYVANPTRQNQIFFYRPDMPKPGEVRPFSPPRQQEIPAGRQFPVGGDLTTEQLEAVVRQLTSHGAVDVSEAKGGRRLASLVFNVGAPVPAPVIQAVMNVNAGILVEEGRLRRQRAAIAVNEAVQNVVNDQFAQQGFEATATDSIEVGFEQLEESGEGEKKIEEGYRMQPDSDGRPGKPSKSPARPPRRAGR